MSGLQTLLLLVGTVTCFLDWNSFELLRETFFPRMAIVGVANIDDLAPLIVILAFLS